MSLFDEIKKMIIEAASPENDTILPEAHLQDDLGADSLAILNLAETISEQYGIDLQADDIVDLENIGELLKLVETRISSKT